MEAVSFPCSSSSLALSSRNVLLLEFRAQGNLTAEKPYLFELENLEWLTPEQFDAVKTARGLGNSAARKKQGEQ